MELQQQPTNWMRLIVKGLYLRLVLLEMHLCWVGTKEDANGSSFQLRAIAARIGPMPFLCTHYLPLLLPLLLLHSLLVESWSWFLNYKDFSDLGEVHIHICQKIAHVDGRLLPTVAHVSKCSFQQRLIPPLKHSWHPRLIPSLKHSWHPRLIPDLWCQQMVLSSKAHASNGSC